MSPAGSLLIAEIGGRKSSIGVLSPRLFFKGSRSTKKSNGFLFVVTSNLLISAATNVRFAQTFVARYESGSIVITTNRPFRDWGRIFDVDNTLATAMIDRLMHHGEAMVIQGSSFRTKGETPDE